MNVPMSRFYIFGQHFCTFAPCIVHYYTLYWYIDQLSYVSTISVSVSTKQLMSELGCECDRSRSRTGRCYLLSCYLEWSRCVQIMSIQHQDTIHQPASSQTNRFWFICHSFQSDRDVRKVLKCYDPWFGDNTFREKLTLTLYKTIQFYFTCEYITLTLHLVTYLGSNQLCRKGSVGNFLIISFQLLLLDGVSAVFGSSGTCQLSAQCWSFLWFSAKLTSKATQEKGYEGTM